ncbi:bifunctional DNA-formamidopyrimidine glycosylase/DNA-(apurinic or apyrimidinic site) lyase [Demetria terragena]|uniref:bifunctional DNA-formamidopyrimidine glycosylase/DNA-(apurinic or apyrimidinic site) lyase n=1 Tax=Demetria terragena TaxID=63959 RepID=UPI00035D4F60|nr:bifunctional DNA-formamidopyrimidine glycosylase/DNA-(apurinic or apyrimidinic site) lyase [Demetria terragena]
MPELPEVEVVRRGLAEHVVGRTFSHVEVTGTRAARRHLPGPADLADRLTGRTVTAVQRRGKYLWLVLDEDEALVVHLGMSGQMLVESADAPMEKHAHAVFDLSSASSAQQLRFIDQRTFGGLQLDDLVPAGEREVPTVVAHIAADPLEAAFDQKAVVRRMKGKHTEIKRALLDQSLVSGIGNIYADEALWRAKVHGRRMTDSLTKPALGRVLDHAAEVMREALSQGGTSFDELYVNVNGASGYFSRSLDVYGREGHPCRRCAMPIRRESFMNRSSHFCPSCQRSPR